MAVPAYIVAARLAPDRAWMRIVFASALLTSWDLALDPAMSFVTSYWIWQEPGIYYGQCSELCGDFHAFMPIMIRAVSKEDYEAWAEQAQAEFARAGDVAVDVAQRAQRD